MKKITLAFSFLCLVATSGFSQLLMTRSTYVGSYSPISLPTATLSTATGDDVAESAIPIGFTFNYLGTNYSTIGVNTNGVASFSAVMSTSATNNNLFATNAPNLSLAPWWDNLISDTVLYQLQGAPGSQTFTIQWTNSFSYFNTATQQLNFQIILHETTNVIEFSYGNLVAGIAAANESASIGIEGATGGPGDYLDAVTGSAFTSNGMINAATQWPSHNFRFTPGAPSPIIAGTYTVGIAGNYYSLSEAIADLNHRGISGAVSLLLIDANYDVTPTNGDNFFPMLLGPVSGSSSVNSILIAPSNTATITSEGTQNGNCGNAAANNVISNTNEPIFALVGASYVGLQFINFTCSSTGVVDRGLQVINSSATLGSQNNNIQNVTVALNRANTGCYGISQQAITTPTAASGANSNNNYYNLTISNVYTGIYLNGNAAFPDLTCKVGTTFSSGTNYIGAATANDIGAGVGATASYGIRANNQSGVWIYNNEVRNISHGGNSTCEGIVIDAGQGSSKVYNNKVHDINYTGATSTANVSGIRVNLATTGVNQVDVYNNFVYAIGSTYSGAATANRAVKGIFAQSIAGNNTSIINVDFNNVRMDNSGSPNLSGTCFESGATNGPVINTRNNVFANFTVAQAGIANHFTMATPTTNAIGNTGSISNYNDFYINDLTNGFTGIGQTTTYASLANWQVGMTQDANAFAVDPGFSSVTDLHISAVPLNNSANMTGITWVTSDFDYQVRSVTPDVGADEFVLLLLDAGITSLISPVNNGCHTSTEQVTVSLKNFASVPLDFSVNNVTVTVNITGAVTQTLNFTITNNALNGNVPLPSGSSMNVPVGLFNMTLIGTYTLNSNTTLVGDGNNVNDAMPVVNINYGPGNATISTNQVCAGSSVILTLSGFSTGGTIQWQSSTDGGITWNNEIGTGATTPIDTVIPTANALYQVLFCGTLITNNVSVTYNTLSSPTVVNDTVCGPGIVNLSATGSGTINWYDAAVAGNLLATGATYSPNISTTTTYYVTNTSGSVTSGVGLFDNSAGGGQSASVNNLIFDVISNCTLNGVYVYPAAAGNVVIDLEDNTNAILNTVTFAVTSTDINQRTFIPLNFGLTPATGMQLVRNFASVNCWRNNVGVNFPYTLPGILDITTSTAGNGFYYFFYDWQIGYGCESPVDSIEVVVLPSPAISVSAASTILCGGDSTTITVTSTNSNYGYTWSPGATLNTITGTSVIATPLSAITYTVNALDPSSGCRAIDSVSIAVNIVPTLVIAATDTLICSGQSDTLSVIGGLSVGLFDNSAGGGQSASPNNLIFDVLGNCILSGVYVYPAAAGNVIIELQDNTNAVINTVTVAVSATDINQKTFIPLNFALTPATGMQLVRNVGSVNCWRNNVGVNYPYTLPGYIDITTSTAGNGFYYFFYDWQVQGPFTFAWSSVPTGFTAIGDTAFVSPTVSTQYIVTVTDTITGCTKQFVKDITIAPPVVAVISGNNSICIGDSTLLFAGYNGGNGIVSYLWSTGSSIDSISVIPSTTTTYSLTATDGCGTTSTVSTIVTVNTSPPIAAFTFLCTGVNTFAFTDASTNATSWSWDFGDSQTSNLQNPTNVYAFTNTYTVTLIVSNGCGSDTITQVIIVDGIAPNEFANSISVFPNPANNNFNVAFASGNSSNVTIQLFNLQGKLMQEKQISNVKSGTSVPMNIEGYADGMYMLKLSGENGSATYKIVVE